MMLATARCCAQASRDVVGAAVPEPGHLESRSGVSSSTSSVSMPKVSTMRFAKPGPMPGISPEPEVALEPDERVGRDGHERLDAELLAVARIVHELAR